MESSKQLKVCNNRDARVVLRRVATTTPQVLLEQLIVEPGANLIDRAEFDKYMLIDGCKEFVDEGTLTVSDHTDGTADTLPKFGADISRAKIKVALKAIAECKDTRQLATWIKQDGRHEVREALVKRYTDLQKDLPEQKLDVDGKS